jgi:hypothetical protein
MLSKESKIRVLENFYGLDYIFFGKPLLKIESCCPIVKEEYMSVKGALLSVYIEMLKLVSHKPKVIKEKLATKDIHNLAREGARYARKTSRKVVTTEKARVDIKADLKQTLKEDKNTDITSVVESKIREKAFRLAVDSLLVARTLAESENVKTLNTWEGKIIEDSYKILRDGLCEAATLILDD